MRDDTSKLGLPPEATAYLGLNSRNGGLGPKKVWSYISAMAALTGQKSRKDGFANRRRGWRQAFDEINAVGGVKHSMKESHLVSSMVGEAKQPHDARGCLMVMLPDLSDEIKKFAARINDSTLTGDGIETETHATVLYGFKPDFDATTLQEFLSGYGPVVLKLGKVSRFECPEYDVIKVDVESPGLERLNGELDDEFSAQIIPSEHAYHPHVTIAYVLKGTNKELDGSEYFEGKVLEVTSALYSLPEHKDRSTITLTENTNIYRPDLRQAVRKNGFANKGAVGAVKHSMKENMTNSQKAAKLVEELLGGDEFESERRNWAGPSIPVLSLGEYVEELNGGGYDAEFVQVQLRVIEQAKKVLGKNIEVVDSNMAEAEGESITEVLEELEANCDRAEASGAFERAFYAGNEIVALEHISDSEDNFTTIFSKP